MTDEKIDLTEPVLEIVRAGGLFAIDLCASLADKAASDPVCVGDQYAQGWRAAAERIANDIRAMREAEDE